MLGRLSDDLAGGWLPRELDKYLTVTEIEATRIRTDKLIRHRVHPYPPEDWPAVPWPPV